MLEVQIQRTRSALTRLTRQSDFYRVQLIDNTGGAKTVLDVKEYQTSDFPGWFHTPTPIEVVDEYDGTTGSTNWVRVYINGILAASLSPSNSDNPNSSGLDFAGNFTRRVGIAFNGNSDGNAKACRAYGGRIIETPSSAQQTPSVGRPDIVIFGPNTIVSGTKGEDAELTAATQANHDVSTLGASQEGHTGVHVEAISRLITFTNESAAEVTRRRVLSTDGTDALVYDPVEKKVAEWDITKGGGSVEADLAGFKLVANHGPCVLIAATDANGAIWALSAREDRTGVRYWQNFNPSDTGITDLNCAVVGGNGGYGLPADEILALAEVPNDDSSYETLMLGSRSIWSLRGHPRDLDNGGLSMVSSSTGCIGPRALCFDDKGNLYWLGSGALHAMPKGSRSYTGRDGGRFPEHFRNADASTHEFSMAFDGTRSIMVYATPKDANQSDPLIAVYDIPTGEFVEDTMAEGMEPAAVLETTGQRQEDRNIMVVGLDGYVREYRDGSSGDDGEPIDFMLDFAPAEAEGADDVLFAEELAVEASHDTRNVVVTWYAAESSESAADLEPGEYENGVLGSASLYDRTGTLFTNAGARQDGLIIGVTGRAHRVILRQFSATDKVCIERVRGLFADVGGT